ncbi:hypothetical protein COV18_03235 [Candidatus Woesearchaeota archaeon CG10_big_fil_rev_8_21_14_0_10_37_12]|nr:MAG: hypothetical protein COV18_03235 [Candidatus Woesearchaeota archaeon CG10_big_fil_rev_8_21_14_0_10_37_12]
MRKLPSWLELVEKFVDKSIPFVLVLLTALLIVEFFHFADNYLSWIHAADSVIVGFFVVDLCFKWYRTRNLLKFMKMYWIDIIAVFPFYTAFRLYASVRDLTFIGEQTQKVLHEAVLLRETRLLREGEFAAKVASQTRILRYGRFVRVFARVLRLFKARFYITHWQLDDVSKRIRH